MEYGIDEAMLGILMLLYIFLDGDTLYRPITFEVLKIDRPNPFQRTYVKAYFHFVSCGDF